MVIGSSGAGKSTLARRLGERLGIEVIHLDALFWKPGWVETPRPEWAALQRELVRRPAWIMDGGYGGTLDIRYQAADTIVFLDLPRLVCIWRAIKRRVANHGRTRPDMAAGCPERLDPGHLKYIWDYPKRRRGQVLQKLAEYAASKRCVHLRSNRDVDRFIGGLSPH